MSQKQSKNNELIEGCSSSVIIRSDGTLLVRRGSSKHNKVMCDLLENMTSIDDLEDFFKITENSEIIFGKENMCG